MISLHVIDLKAFMNQLLVKNVFDNFLLSELEISTYNNFKINGKLNLGWFDDQTREQLGERQYSTWAEIKPIAYNLIKGKTVPSFFKIIFVLSPENQRKILDKGLKEYDPTQVGSFFLNLHYENKSLHLITGVSKKVFTLDKAVDQEWDSNMKQFLKHYEIAVEEE